MKNLYGALDAGNIERLMVLLDQTPQQSSQELGQLLIYTAQSVEPPTCNEATKLLLNYNANCNARDAEGRTALMLACVQNRQELVELLLEAGADCNARDADTETVLMWAAGAGNAEIVQRLLEAGADIHAQSDMEGTALRWAVKSGSRETARVLLEHGADMYAPMVLGYTLSRHQNEPLLELFLKQGLEMERKIVENYGVMEWAQKCGHGNLVRRLKEYQRLSRTVI